MGKTTHLKIYEILTNNYEKYMAMVTWDQDTDSFNSDNMWFPMPPNISLYLTVPVAQGKSIQS